MIAERKAQHELPNSNIHIRHIDHVVTPEDSLAITQYSALLLEPRNLAHFSWPLFDIKDLEDVDPSQLYDEEGNPQVRIVEKVAIAASAILNSSDDFLTTIFDDDNDGPVLIGAGFASSLPKSENDLWMYKDVVAAEKQEKGYGTQLVAECMHEAFKRYPNLKNIYIGVTYDKEITDTEKVALQHMLQNIDIFHALRNGATISTEEIQRRINLIRNIFATHHHPFDLTQFGSSIVDSFSEPAQGITPTSMKRRRDMLVHAAGELGLTLTPSERVYLKLGAYHTQLLSEQAHIAGHKDLPTARLVVKREIWEGLSPQLQEEGILSY